MSQDDIKLNIHDAFNDEPEVKSAAPAPGSGNPTLPIAAVVIGVLGLVLGIAVSWILSVVAGIVAIVLGALAKKKASPRPKLALAGIVLGILDILSSALLVALFLYKLASIGLL